MVEALPQQLTAGQAFRKQQVALVDQQGARVVGDLRCSAWQVAQGGQSDVAFLGVELDAPLEEFLEILLVAGNQSIGTSPRSRKASNAGP